MVVFLFEHVEVCVDEVYDVQSMSGVCVCVCFVPPPPRFSLAATRNVLAYRYDVMYMFFCFSFAIPVHRYSRRGSH